MSRLAVILLALTLGGCGARLPTYEPAPADETWRAMRAQTAEHISAAGDLTLWTDRGRATLQCAIASDDAGNFRLRAWKLDQATLDITLAGGDLWVYAPQAEEDLEQLRAADMARAWRLLSGAIFETPPPPGDERDGSFEYTTADGVRITIDRATRTARRFELDTPDTADGALILELGRFQIIDGRPWPMRLDLRAGERRARIRLDTVELGLPAPEGAFIPPRRAMRVEAP